MHSPALMFGLPRRYDRSSDEISADAAPTIFPCLKYSPKPARSARTLCLETEEALSQRHHWRARMTVRSAPQYLHTLASGRINSAQRSQGTRGLSSRGVVALLPRQRIRITIPNVTANNIRKGRNSIRLLNSEQQMIRVAIVQPPASFGGSCSSVLLFAHTLCRFQRHVHGYMQKTGLPPHDLTSR